MSGGATSTSPIAAALWVDTARALATPRRLIPVLAVAMPLLLAQHTYSVLPLTADGLAVMMVVGFLALAPFAWRWTSRLRFGWVLYVPIAVFPFLLAVAMTRWGELTQSFLVEGVNAAVGVGLFLVGGWGLGRDIDLEQQLRREEQRSAALERQARAAELLAVRAHLDPHFLFNTLNAIAEWCAVDPLRAETAILQLSALLREILGGVREELWPLERELAIAVDVLSLHRSRDPTWFDLEVIGEPQGTIPPLLLLPLVENAVKHGPAKGARGVISLKLDALGPNRRIEIRNPGSLGPPREGSAGLPMVKERLRLAYGAAGSLVLREEDGETVAILILP